MIIGNGLIGKSFEKANLNDWLIFASGVSDSNEINLDKFKREKDLLTKTLKENNGLKIIYFSSVLVGVSDKPYYKHKLEMENIIKSELCNYIIFRVPQIVGPNGNENNLFNHFQEKIKANGLNLVYSGVERALVDIDDLVKLVIYATEHVIDETIVLSYIEKIGVLDLCHRIAKKLQIEPIIALKSGDTENKNSFAGNWNLENSKVVVDWLMGVNVRGYTNKIIDKYIKQ